VNGFRALEGEARKAIVISTSSKSNARTTGGAASEEILITVAQPICHAGRLSITQPYACRALSPGFLRGLGVLAGDYIGLQ
jgi:hypothetical protein